MKRDFEYTMQVPLLSREDSIGRYLEFNHSYSNNHYFFMSCMTYRLTFTKVTSHQSTDMRSQWISKCIRYPPILVQLIRLACESLEFCTCNWLFFFNHYLLTNFAIIIIIFQDHFTCFLTCKSIISWSNLNTSIWCMGVGMGLSLK